MFNSKETLLTLIKHDTLIRHIIEHVLCDHKCQALPLPASGLALYLRLPTDDSVLQPCHKHQPCSEVKSILPHQSRERKPFGLL